MLGASHKRPKTALARKAATSNRGFSASTIEGIPHSPALYRMTTRPCATISTSDYQDHVRGEQTPIDCKIRDAGWPSTIRYAYFDYTLTRAFSTGCRRRLSRTVQLWTLFAEYFKYIGVTPNWSTMKSGGNLATQSRRESIIAIGATFTARRGEQ